MANKDAPELQDVMRAFADGNHEAVAAALAEAADAPLLHDELAKVATVMREPPARDQLRVSRTMSALRTPLHELQKWFDELAACGLKPIAVFGKVPKRVNWQQHDVVAERTALVEGDNIGVLGGSPLNRGVICFGDLDFDDTSAYDAAVQVPSLKGRPQRVTGKAGRGAIPFPVPAGTPYRKLEWKRECDGREIAMELRSTGGHQTVVAGIHSETKQPIQWSQWSDPNSWGMVDLFSLWKEISAVLAPLGWQPKHTFTAEDFKPPQQVTSHATAAIETSPMPEHEAKTLCDGIIASKAYARGSVARETWLALPRNLMQLGVPDGMTWDVWDKVYAGDNKTADDREAAHWASSGGAIGPGSLIAHCKDRLDGGARDILVKHATEHHQKMGEAAFREAVEARALERRAHTRLSTYAPPPIAWRIQSMLPCVGTGFVFASHYTGKTALVVDLIAAMTCGQGQMWGGRTVRPLASRETVLIVAFEGHLGLKGRVTAAAKHRGGDISPSIHMITPDSGRGAIQAIRVELEAARKLGEPCAFVMVDTWSAARFTRDDNNANEVATVLAEFNKIALDYGTCIVFLDHITKNPETGKSAPRGSGVKLASTSFGYALNDGTLTFEKVKDAERPQQVRFETATGAGSVIVNWVGVPQGDVSILQGSRRVGESKVDDIKLNMASYTSGVGIEDAWGALDAGKFVKFAPANHAQYLQGYRISDDVMTSTNTVCTLGTFKDGLRNMFGVGKGESTERMRIKRLKEAGHILVVGAYGGKVPIVLMRGAGWVNRLPWE
jgi:hypothetical protein